MGRSKEEFLNSTTRQIVRMIDIQTNGIKEKSQVKYVNSMRDFLR
jgi:hypothetical protein